MLYLIGLGLDVAGISKKGLDAIKKCKKVYVDNYTVEFPYSIAGLANIIDKKPLPAGRGYVEGMKIVDEAKRTEVALLVYGSPLTATTHIALIDEAKKSKVKVRVIHNASILDAVAETGLQVYKFGKTASMPGFKADSYIDVVKDNLKIKAHTLILVDIGMKFQDALRKLLEDSRNKAVEVERVVICSRLGTDTSRIYYGKILALGELDVRAPFCFIVPGELHFLEKEFLEGFS